ncbi:glandular kallikrein-like [Aquarana catesbeiana]|uniref:glandular kallikrein-like n=1 Tax=Aquarana catesbeiana TaxID=8400 RepID=UPI003CC9CC87
MKLSKRAILTKAVKLLPLPTTFEDPKEGSTCETAGWGITEKAHASDILLETNVTIFNREQCAKHWKHRNNITENMVCTIVRHGGGSTCIKEHKRSEDWCIGDSGGPLICNGVLTGLTSFGEFKCGKVNDAPVFTRLTKEYIRWINEEITD